MFACVVTLNNPLPLSISLKTEEKFGKYNNKVYLPEFEYQLQFACRAMQVAIPLVELKKKKKKNGGKI
jgi:hypothetical protein